LPQPFKHLLLALGKLIEAEDTMVGPRHLARHGHLAPTDQPPIGNRMVGGAKGPGGDDGGAPPGAAGDAMVRVVSMASARVVSGRIVVRRRARIDVPAPGGPRSKTLWSERLHDLQFYQNLQGC
jgi:hypothetical protein